MIYIKLNIGTIIGIGFDSQIDINYIKNLNNSSIYNDKEMNYRPIPIVFFELDENKYNIQINNNINNSNIIILKPKEFTLIKSRKRYQLPLTPAFASTVHKVQGITSKYGIIMNPSNTSYDCSNYVGISRCPELDYLSLLKPVSKKSFNNTDINNKNRKNIKQLYDNLDIKFENQLSNLYLYNDFLNDLEETNSQL